MTERERLIDLLNTVIFLRDGADPAEAVADYLIDNGVKLPVRCEECIYHTVVKNKRFPNLVRCDIFGMFVSKDGFCYRGERRADNGN